jgi:hypothetical protein
MNLAWRIDRKIHRLLIGWSKNPRPSSEPFISGDTFRSFADHIYEKRKALDPFSVKEKNIVFVESELLISFFTDIHPQIENRYILITHNGDIDIDDRFIHYIDEKIIHWFAQNAIIAHPKVTPIPIGLENAYYHNNGVVRIFKRITKKKNFEKRGDILYGFNIQTNPRIRQPVFDTLSSYPSAKKLPDWPNPKRYIDSVAKYKFIASPTGNGNDCHRTWEAMLVGTIPIVLRSIGMEYFKSLGLPLLIIDSFDELAHVSEYDLSAKYDLIMSTANVKPLYIDYWKDRINLMRS